MSATRPSEPSQRTGGGWGVTCTPTCGPGERTSTDPEGKGKGTELQFLNNALKNPQPTVNLQAQQDAFYF